MSWNISRQATHLVCWIFATLPLVGAIAVGVAKADIPAPSIGPLLQNPQSVVETLVKKIQSGSLAGKELADAYFGLCQASAQLGRMTDAINACSESIGIVDSAGPRITRGTLYVFSKKFPAALEDFSALTKLNPNDPSGHALSASIYWAMGNTAKFASESDAAMALAANPVPSLKARAELYFNTGHWALALADYDTLLSREPSDAEIFRYRGDAKTYLRDYDGGMLDYDQAISLDPKGQLTPVTMARTMSFFDRQKYDDAAAQAKIAADSAPNNAYHLLRLNLIRIHAGKPDQGDFARRAANLDHSAWPYGIIAFQLGTIAEDKVWAAAEKGTSQEVAGQKCEADYADYYVGEYKLNISKPEAINLLKHAASTCPKGFIEAFGAASELRALGEDIKF